jgi:hypothetical protein
VSVRDSDVDSASAGEGARQPAFDVIEEEMPPATSEDAGTTGGETSVRDSDFASDSARLPASGAVEEETDTSMSEDVEASLARQDEASAGAADAPGVRSLGCLDPADDRAVCIAP